LGGYPGYRPAIITADISLERDALAEQYRIPVRRYETDAFLSAIDNFLHRGTVGLGTSWGERAL
jgi:hypothetical protein